MCVREIERKFSYEERLKTKKTITKKIESIQKLERNLRKKRRTS